MKKNSFPAKAFTSWVYNWHRANIRHPKYRWWMILGTLVYLLNPFDVLPDAIPLIGWIDDGLIATVLVTEMSQLLSDRLKSQKQQKSIDISAENAGVIDVDAVPLS